ncbi:unnamed protein product [Symbiodinium sp. KB8]|nr:unnamed protein product [Symbiodinium sp. KB8]
MDASLVQQLESIRDDAGLAVNVKAKKMLEVLKQGGYLYEQLLDPSQLIVHSDNRSGMMVNAYNVHCRGQAALKVGWSMAKLTESYCMELSQNTQRRQAQLDSMRALVEASDGKLAGVSGTERFASLSSSHMSQFCKAVRSGCSSEHESLPSVLALETVTKQYTDEQFATAVRQGWVWNCISACVDDAVGWFADFLQASLNASNHIAGRLTEMEIAMNLAAHYKRTGSMEASVEACRAMCELGYLDAIAEWVKKYTGGEQFLLIQFLAGVERSFSSSVLLGEEYFRSVASTDFGSKESTFPLVRCMLLACNLSSPKLHVQDGFARLLVKADVDRLKTAAGRDQAALAEKMAMLVLQEIGDHLLDNVKLVGRFFLRAGLWLTKKEGKGHEKHVFGSLETIHKAFMLEKEKSQANYDAKSIATQRYSWLVPGKKYIRNSDIFEFVDMQEQHGRFTSVDIFGQESMHEIPHSDLKNFRLTDKLVPAMLAAEKVTKLQMDVCDSWTLELEKAQVQAAVLTNHSERESLLDVSQLVFTNTHKIFTGEKIKKSGLRIFPFGTVVLMKDEALRKPDALAGKIVVKVKKTGHYYQVLAGKVDLQKETGAIPAFCWVSATEDEEAATMELGHSLYAGWLEIPCLRPKKPLEKHVQLLYYKAPVQSSRKKAKTK